MKFRLASGGVQEFQLEYQPMDGELMPIKLGDGNFGIVFAAQSEAEQLALKVIYEHQTQPDLTSQVPAVHARTTRVLDELTVRSTIFSELLDATSVDPVAASALNNYADHLVLPIAYTENLFDEGVFEDDEEGKAQFFKAKEVLAAKDIQLSKYAYLMPRYESTLKDLVELPAGEAATETSSGGYSQLADVALAIREYSAMPVLQGVAEGLKVLHLARLRHQDIKPANIFYRESEGRVKFHLGDLGFLRPQNPVLAGSMMASSKDLAIGTKHYRSVEQIDFSDTCEVDVQVDRENKIAKLVSRDPKFARTNIFRGDRVFFPKSTSQHLFLINSLEVRDDERTTEIVIQLNDESEDQSRVIYDDERTQAAFVKNPTARTDLFGLGGILFDIITAGDSPERFYELLRKFDVRGESINNTILSNYETWRSGQFVDPEISAIFQRVNGGNEVAGVSEQTLSFLLKCCMSEPEDSFFNQFAFYEETNALGAQWDGILSKIEDLRANAPDRRDFYRVTTNALTGGTTDVSESTRSENTLSSYLGLESQLAGATNLENDGEQARRDLSGERLLKRLVVVQLIADKANQILENQYRRLQEEIEFISFSPEHLSFERDYSSITESTNFGILSPQSVVEKMRNLDPQICSLLPFVSKFHPVWWNSRARRTHISLKAQGDLYECLFSYLDWPNGWRGFAIGDFVVMSAQGASNAIFCIKSVDRETAILELIGPDSLTLADVPTEQVPGCTHISAMGYIIKKLELVDYLAGMVAVYIFHLLFHNKPDLAVNDLGVSASDYKKRGFLLRPSETTIKSGKNSSVLPGLASKLFKNAEGITIAEYTQNLCIWLMLGGYSAQLESTSPQQAVQEIRSEVNKWIGFCARALNVDTLDFNVIDPRHDADVPQTFQRENALDQLKTFAVSQDDWDIRLKTYLARSEDV